MTGDSQHVAAEVEQRVLTALRCEQPDRVPVLVDLNPYVEEWYTHLPSYADVLSAVERYADVVFNWRFPAPFMFTAAVRWIEQRDLGSNQVEQIIHTPDGPITEVVRTGWRERDVVKRWIRTVEDAERALSMPYVPVEPDLETFFDTKARLAGKIVAQVTFREPIAVADWIDERSLATWCADQRNLVRRLLDAAFERIAGGLRACLRAGVGPIYALTRCRSAALEVLSSEDFAEVVVEYDRRLVELIRAYEGVYVILPAGGKVKPVVERLSTVGMNALTVIDPPLDGDYGLAELKRRIGDRVCLIAGLPYEELQRSNPARIEQSVRQALAAGGAGGGFMLSPCAPPRVRDLSDQASANLIHYLKTACRTGRYPIGV